MTITPTARCGRLQGAWAAVHRPVVGVPPWVRAAAYTIPFTALPASLWRIAVVTFHAPIAVPPASDRGGGNLPSWLPVEIYVLLLSIFSELIAFTAVGLISTWGEIWPRWIPGLRGRRIPILAAVIPAALGATALTLVWTWVSVAVFRGRTITNQPLPADFPLRVDDWQGLLAIAAYAPLLAWGPLLAIVTLAYYQRRTRRAHQADS